jgi:hypothetical protein
MSNAFPRQQWLRERTSMLRLYVVHCLSCWSDNNSSVKLRNFTQQSPSSEDDSESAIQAISRRLWAQKPHYRLRNNPSS